MTKDSKALTHTVVDENAEEPRRTDVTVISRRTTLIAEMRLRNPAWTLERIAEEYKMVTGESIGKSSVHRHLNKIRAEWAVERVNDYNMYVNMEMHRLDILEQEAWDAWRRSMEADFSEEFVELVNPGDYAGIREVARNVSRAVQKEIVNQGGNPVDRDAIEDVIMQTIPESTYLALTGEVGPGGAMLSGQDGGGQLVASRVTRMTRKGPGNPNLLKMILEIQKERHKIQGVYSPDKIHVRQDVYVKGYSGAWDPDVWDRDVLDGEAVPAPLLESGDEYGEFVEDNETDDQD